MRSRKGWITVAAALAVLASPEVRSQPPTGARGADGGPGGGGARVDGWGTVFFPDPLTRARAVYGQPGFVDDGDADTPQLTEQLVQVPLLDITYDGEVYSLVGPWAVAVEHRPPVEGPYTSISPSFLFTRSEQMFEAVNAYYHIDRFMRYLNDTLGVSVRPHHYSGGVRFDPHGTPGSVAYYSLVDGVIVFGEGNVDKAEDADVILHELGHAIQDWLTQGDFALRIGGGTADYWANSYARTFGRWTPEDEQYYWIFHWASHNEFGEGRVTNYAGVYPDDLTGDDHVDGQILSSALMEVWDEIGREATDRNMLAALAMTAWGDDQEDFARAFVQADLDVHGGAHLGVIVPILEARGYGLTPTGTEPAPDVSPSLEVGAPFPNPTRGEVTIRLSAATAQIVRVDLVDLLGRVVATLYEGPLGAREVRGVTFDGDAVTAGTYTVRVVGERSVVQRRVTVLP